MDSVEPQSASQSLQGQQWFTPPRFKIDLSAPPEERYLHVAQIYKEELRALPRLFDEVLAQAFPGQGKVPVVVKRMAAWFLRSLHSNEESRELVGISRVTGIQMHLLIAFNVLLDLFMGCTSGGMRVTKGKGPDRMLHFRTLDWGMDPLRNVIVQFDFINSINGSVVASTVSYVGFVGVLTGVRPGLSLSLNFRPNHDASTRTRNFQFYFHHLMVLFGRRPSISSLLRKCLLPSPSEGQYKCPDLSSIEQSFPQNTTTAAYLVFSDGDRTVTMEKDHRTALVRSSGNFIVVTNHDVDKENKTSLETTNRFLNTGMAAIVEESTERKDCIVQKWKRVQRKTCKANLAGNQAALVAITEQTLKRWINTYPVTNEETHFACVMDPKDGVFRWIKGYSPVICVDDSDLPL